jgi:hypothetical protein
MFDNSEPSGEFNIRGGSARYAIVPRWLSERNYFLCAKQHAAECPPIPNHCHGQFGFAGIVHI